MTCEEFARFIDALPLRERTREEMQKGIGHAEKCPSCAARLDAARRLEAELSVLSQIAPSENVLRNVMDRVARGRVSVKEPVRKGRREIFRWAAMVIGGLALAVGYLHGMEPGSWLNRLLSVPGGVGMELLVSQPAWGILMTGVGLLLIGAAMLWEHDRGDRAVGV